jgi:hypothetical protein
MAAPELAPRPNDDATIPRAARTMRPERHVHTDGGATMRHASADTRQMDTLRQTSPPSREGQSAKVTNR